MWLELIGEIPPPGRFCLLRLYMRFKIRLHLRGFRLMVPP
jgi:hypothetical protein